MSARPRAAVHVQVDEPWARVTEYRFAPQAETGWHRHEHDYVVVPLMDGRLRLEEAGGSVRVAELRRHVSYTRRAGIEHNVVNASDGEFAFLEVELLDGG